MRGRFTAPLVNIAVFWMTCFDHNLAVIGAVVTNSRCCEPSGGGSNRLGHMASTVGGYRLHHRGRSPASWGSGPVFRGVSRGVQPIPGALGRARPVAGTRVY